MSTARSWIVAAGFVGLAAGAGVGTGSALFMTAKGVHSVSLAVGTEHLVSNYSCANCAGLAVAEMPGEQFAVWTDTEAATTRVLRAVINSSTSVAETVCQTPAADARGSSGMTVDDGTELNGTRRAPRVYFTTLKTSTGKEGWKVWRCDLDSLGQPAKAWNTDTMAMDWGGALAYSAATRNVYVSTTTPNKTNAVLSYSVDKVRDREYFDEGVLVSSGFATKAADLGAIGASGGLLYIQSSGRNGSEVYRVDDDPATADVPVLCARVTPRWLPFPLRPRATNGTDRSPQPPNFATISDSPGWGLWADGETGAVWAGDMLQSDPGQMLWSDPAGPPGPGDMGVGPVAWFRATTSSPSASPTTSPTMAPVTSQPTAQPVRPPPAPPQPPPPPPLTSTPSDAPSRSPSYRPSASPSSSPEVAPVPLSAEQNGAAGTAAVVATAAGGGAGPIAVQLAVLTDDSCGDSDTSDDVPWVLHPLRFEVDGSQRAGAVVGNALLLVGIGLLNMLAALALRACTGEGASARCRFPGGTLLASVTLYSGVTHNAAWLVLGSDSSTAHRAIGAAAAVFVTATLPAALWFLVLRHVQLRALYELEDPPPGRVRWFVLGQGDWVSAECSGGHALWFERWGGVFKPLGPRIPAAGLLLKLAEAATVGTIQAVPRDSCRTCASLDTAVGVVLLLFGALLAYLRPYQRPRDDCAFSLATLLQSAAMSVRGYSRWADSGTCGSGSVPIAASVLLVGAAGILLMSAVTDALCIAYAIAVSRRFGLFRQYLIRTGRWKDAPALVVTAFAPKDGKGAHSGFFSDPAQESYTGLELGSEANEDGAVDALTLSVPLCDNRSFSNLANGDLRRALPKAQSVDGPLRTPTSTDTAGRRGIASSPRHAGRSRGIHYVPAVGPSSSKAGSRVLAAREAALYPSAPQISSGLSQAGSFSSVGGDSPRVVFLPLRPRTRRRSTPPTVEPLTECHSFRKLK